MTNTLPICKRLRAVEYGNDGGFGHCVTAWHRNPDGPEAADIIEALVDATEMMKNSSTGVRRSINAAVVSASALDAIMAALEKARQ